jgi:Zn-dependent protease with chaperone function
MTVAVYLPLVLAAALAEAARWFGARGAPGPAARALTMAAAVTALASTWSLTLLALTLFDDVPPLSSLDTHPRLALPEPVPGPIALVAAVLLVCGLWRLLADLKRRHGTHRQLRRAGQPHSGLVVADWADPVAIAVPGRPGHILVTTGILKALDPAERRVLFAHERAHLTHHHHRLVAVTAAAAALNPLLAPAREAVAYLVERWADEDAAAEVGDRALTARAVARAALATVDTGSTVALALHGGPVVRRVRALSEPAPTIRRRLIPAVLLGAGCLVTTAAATAEFIALARAWL